MGAPTGGEEISLTQSLSVGHHGSAITNVAVAHHDEPPRLAMANARSAMAGPQHGVDEFFGDVVVAVTADVTSSIDSGVQPLLYLVAQGPSGGVCGSGGRRSGVSDSGNRAVPAPTGRGVFVRDDHSMRVVLGPQRPVAGMVWQCGS